MSKVTVKQALDELFRNIVFDTTLYKKIVFNNIEFITRNNEYKELFGNKAIGYQLVKYTTYDKNIFYNNLFNLEYDEVITVVSSITTINKSFKIARDDINLICFYVAHRFLTNESLSKEKRLEYAKEIFNYFNYRTLVLITANYFVYPISEEKALSLTERLSNRYLIKKLKNWNEYCQYRSDEFMNTKYLDVTIKFNKDDDIPNAINDLYNRTKDTMKNIYKEFITMLEEDTIIKSKKAVVNDIEGQEVILDKLNTPDSYYTKLERQLSDRNTFIQKDKIDVTIDIVNTVSYKVFEECLGDIVEYSYTSKENNELVRTMFKSILLNAIEYLQRNNVHLNNNTNVLSVINHIVGNVLYARGSDVVINQLKDNTDKLLKKIFKHYKRNITDRNVKNIRNAVYVYVVLSSLI